MKRAVKNHLERAMPELRKKILALPELSRRLATYDELHAALIWLEIDIRKLRDELYEIQNQEELLPNETDPTNDPMRT